MLEGIDPQKINNLEDARQVIIVLMNLAEKQAQENLLLRQHVQLLRDEINRLRGEQGKPKINPQTKSKDISSESERHKPKERHTRHKNALLRIDRHQTLTIQPSELPPDAVKKGYTFTLVQDLKIETDNVLFKREKYYSPALQQTYLAPLPQGYSGQFGPGIKSLVMTEYFAANVSEPKLQQMLEHYGISISAGQISNLITGAGEIFAAESSEVLSAGLSSSPWQQIDETSTRVAGQNQYCQVITAPHYTAYRTTKNKDRLCTLEALRDGGAPAFMYNQSAYRYLKEEGLAAYRLTQLVELPTDELFDQERLDQLLNKHCPGLTSKQRKLIEEGLAIAAYEKQESRPRVLVTDDAGQWRKLSDEQALCWVHEGRHYKKLTPAVDYLAKIHQRFLTRFWRYYHELEAYRQNPTPADAKRLTARFDTLFGTVTGYPALNEQIALTAQKKEALLLVLKYPELPLHNNEAEWAARQRVRKRDVSFEPKTEKGVKAWDNLQTLGDTTRKLGVSFFSYLSDRLRGANVIPPLADLIKQKAAELKLGATMS